MDKLGILIDSFSGYNKKEVEKLGLEYIHQTLIIDGVKYEEGVDDISSSELIKKITLAKDFKTSMPSIGLITDKFDVLSKKYTHLLFIPMVSGMSSTFSTSVAASRDYKNVDVISNKFTGSSAPYYGQKAQKMFKEGKTINEIKKYLKEMSNFSLTWVIPQKVDKLIKSGRLTGFKKFLFEKGKLIPRLFVEETGFIVKGVKRNFVKTIHSVIRKNIDLIGGIKNAKDYHWELIHANDQNSINIAEVAFKNSGINIFSKICAAPIIVGHSGIEAIGIHCYKK